MAPILYKWFFLSCLLFFKGSAVADLAPGKAPAPHPFYISITEISHNAGKKILEISCKMFAEDLEQTLKKNYKMEFDLSSVKDKALLDKYIPDYIRKHFALMVDGKTAGLDYVGYEEDKEAVYCYFQVDNVPVPKKMDITNTLLHDFNQDQINIIHVIVNGKRQSTKLDYPSSQAGFHFAP